jgi:hypothetical protein
MAAVSILGQIETWVSRCFSGEEEGEEEGRLKIRKENKIWVG